MRIANIVALARPGRTRERRPVGEGHCGCVRLCAGREDRPSADLPPTCAIRHLLEDAAARR